jgi:hypothetical protein
MAISYVWAVSWQNNSTAYWVDFNSLKPRVWDLVLVSIFTNSTTDRDMSVTSAGYTEICDLYSNDTADAQLSIWYKVLTSLERDVWINQSLTRTVVQLYRWVDTTTPIDVTSVTASVSNTGVVDCPSITPVTSWAWVLAIWNSSNVGSTPTAPSWYSDLYFRNDYWTYAYSRKSRTSWAEDPWAYGWMSSSTVNSYVACTIALRPSSLPDPIPPTTPYINDWVSNTSVQISWSNIECSMTWLSFTAWDLIFAYIQWNDISSECSTPSWRTSAWYRYSANWAAGRSRWTKLIYKIASWSETLIAYTSSRNSSYPHTCLFFTVKNQWDPAISWTPASQVINGTSSDWQIVPTPSITNSRWWITIVLWTSWTWLWFTSTIPTWYELLAVSQWSSALAYKNTGGWTEDPSSWWLWDGSQLRALIWFTIWVWWAPSASPSFLLFMD